MPRRCRDFIRCRHTLPQDSFRPEQRSSAASSLDSAALPRFGEVNSLCEEPTFLRSRVRESTPPASASSPSPIHLARKQHVLAVLLRVRRTLRPSKVRLASRYSGKLICSIPNQFMARGVPGWFLIPLGVICHTHFACTMRLRQALPKTAFLILLPFLHSPAGRHRSSSSLTEQSELRPHRMSVVRVVHVILTWHHPLPVFPDQQT